MVRSLSLFFFPLSCFFRDVDGRPPAERPSRAATQGCAAMGGATGEAAVSMELLRGHRSEVLCCAAEAGGPPATGDAAGSVRVWDQRAGCRALTGVKCAMLGPAASAVGAGAGAEALEGAGVTAVAWGASEHQLFASLGAALFELDLRAGGVVCGRECVVGDAIFVAEEEINAVSRHGARGGAAGGAVQVAVADDSGAVHVAEVPRRRASGAGDDAAPCRSRRMRNRHDSIASSVAFRPGSAGDLCSGGLDCGLISHDWRTGRRRWGAALRGSSEDGGAQLFNPPMVHRVDFSADGRLLAAALGDGSAAVLDCQRGEELGRVRAHASAMCAAAWMGAAPRPTALGGRRLATAGNDGMLRVWRWPEEPPEEAGGAGEGGAGRTARRKGGAFRWAAPAPVASWRHGVAAGEGAGAAVNDVAVMGDGRLLVCDTSAVVKLYSLR